jgi:hypothetical protein
MCTYIKPSRWRQPSLLTILVNVYNAKRLLSSLDYMPPNEFELKDAMCYHLSDLDFLEAP